LYTQILTNLFKVARNKEVAQQRKQKQTMRKSSYQAQTKRRPRGAIQRYDILTPYDVNTPRHHTCSCIVSNYGYEDASFEDLMTMHSLQLHQSFYYYAQNLANSCGYGKFWNVDNNVVNGDSSNNEMVDDAEIYKTFIGNYLFKQQQQTHSSSLITGETIL
jgi:hypothetical protein